MEDGITDSKCPGWARLTSITPLAKRPMIGAGSMCTQVKDSRIDVRSAILVDRVRSTGENDALRSELELRELLSARQHLREDVELTETACDPSYPELVACPSVTILAKTIAAAALQPGTTKSLIFNSKCNVQMGILRAVQ
jgi:hypothetical protein